MNPNEVPTKGNLMRARNSLKLAGQGYALLDKKRNILTRELSSYTGRVSEMRSQIAAAYHEAYKALQLANLDMGISAVRHLSHTIPIDNSIDLRTRSIMGTEIPLIRCNTAEKTQPTYAFYLTGESLDEAQEQFRKVKHLTVELTALEITARRLSSDIQRTQKRANALKNITIPYYEELVRAISSALEEKEREEFTRLKVIKAQQENKG